MFGGDGVRRSLFFKATVFFGFGFRIGFIPIVFERSKVTQLGSFGYSEGIGMFGSISEKLEYSEVAALIT